MAEKDWRKFTGNWVCSDIYQRSTNDGELVILVVQPDQFEVFH